MTTVKDASEAFKISAPQIYRLANAGKFRIIGGVLFSIVDTHVLSKREIRTILNQRRRPGAPKGNRNAQRKGKQNALAHSKNEF